MQDIAKNERPYNKIRQDIIDLIRSLKNVEGFTDQDLLKMAINIEGDETIKADIIQDLLCHYRDFDLIMDEGLFYPQKKETMWSEKEVQEKIKQAKLDAVKEFAERLKENTLEIELGGIHKYKVISVQGIEHYEKEFEKRLSSGESEEVTTPKETQDLYAMFRMEIDKYAVPLIVDDFLEFVELIRVDGEIVGMCGGADGYIDCLYVLPKHRRQGYAKKLALDWYGRYGRGKNATRLHIVNNNIPALKFWNSVFELKEIECSTVDTLYEIVKVRD